MDITVIGGGYVGLISAVCFCEFGYNVSLVELDAKRYENLKAGKTDVYEPGLLQAIERNMQSGMLDVSDDVASPVADVDAVFIAVAAAHPGEPDTDLSNLYDAMRRVMLSLPRERYTGVFLKTSVPVGTCTTILENFRFTRPDLLPGKHFDLISNPGFLREGSAIHDFLNPNRVIIGLENCDPKPSKKARELIDQVYAPLINLNVPFIYANFPTAELIRSASISFLATKMAFVNEMASLCDLVGADIDAVIRGMALDQGISARSFQISPGIGGSSFPRTVRTLRDTARLMGTDLTVLDGVLESNSKWTEGITNRILSLLKDDESLSEKQVSIWGLAFKPNTNDVNESPSVSVIQGLLQTGVTVALWDPLFLPGSQNLWRVPKDILDHRNFSLRDSAYDAASQGDILVIMTNWSEIVSLDYNKIYALVNKYHGRKPISLDYRKMFTQAELPKFMYIPQGHAPPLARTAIK